MSARRKPESKQQNTLDQYLKVGSLEGKVEKKNKKRKLGDTVDEHNSEEDTTTVKKTPVVDTKLTSTTTTTILTPKQVDEGWIVKKDKVKDLDDPVDKETDKNENTTDNSKTKSKRATSKSSSSKPSKKAKTIKMNESEDQKAPIEISLNDQPSPDSKMSDMPSNSTRKKSNKRESKESKTEKQSKSSNEIDDDDILADVLTNPSVTSNKQNSRNHQNDLRNFKKKKKWQKKVDINLDHFKVHFEIDHNRKYTMDKLLAEDAQYDYLKDDLNNDEEMREDQLNELDAEYDKVGGIHLHGMKSLTFKS